MFIFSIDLTQSESHLPNHWYFIRFMPFINHHIKFCPRKKYRFYTTNRFLSVIHAKPVFYEKYEWKFDYYKSPISGGDLNSEMPNAPARFSWLAERPPPGTWKFTCKVKSSIWQMLTSKYIGNWISTVSSYTFVLVFPPQIGQCTHKEPSWLSVNFYTPMNGIAPR